MFTIGSNLGDCMSMMLFDVLLPMVDMYGDTSLVISWYLRSHYIFATAMMIPMFLNYLFTSFKWCSFEEKETKWWSWTLVVLQFWQPWRAMKIIRLLYKNDPQAQAKKREMMKEVSNIEPFFESVPAVLIMTCLWNHGNGGMENYLHDQSSEIHDLNITHDSVCNISDYSSNMGLNTGMSLEENNYCAIFGGFGGPEWFMTTYLISILTASFGITKFLLHGPCSILTTNGLFGGLLTWRFMMAFTATMFSLLSKVFILMALTNSTKNNLPIYALSFVSVCIVPNVLLAIVNISMATGWNKTLIKVILKYPTILFLPVFTNFTVGPRRISNRVTSQENVGQSHLMISAPMTAVNIVLTSVCSIITVLILATMEDDKMEDVIPWIILILIPLIFSGWITVALLYSNKCCSASCCPTSCFESRCEYINGDQLDNDIEMVSHL